MLRTPVWQDEFLNRLDRCAFLGFAVIWDEDHDDRVIDAVMALYVSGLLSPVRHIGERKSTLTVLLALDVVRKWEPERLKEYGDGIKDICRCMDYPWSAHVDSADGHGHSIIHASPEDVALYPKNIDLLWQLGVGSRTQTT
ncbi:MULTISPECIES: hypothetical protein [Paraburkholderia]|uniref:hypothetical protein n=1 Tax=Paraburkholderia TaxID=1822464 RepID=UPI0038BDF6D6